MKELFQFVNGNGARNVSVFEAEVVGTSSSLTNFVLRNTIGISVDVNTNFTTMAETTLEPNRTDLMYEILAAGSNSSLPGSGEMPLYGYIICIVTMLFIWLVGSTGNFLVIYVVCREKQLQTPMNMFLVNLSLADFLTSAFGSPFPLLASIMHRWPFGDTMCTIYAFGMSLGGITSITTLMVLAFERYLMIARPFRAADIKLHHSSSIILFIWVYSLMLTLPPLVGWSSYGPEGPYISCSVSWEKDDLGTTTYICFLFVLGLVLPLITIVFSYVGIVTTIKSTSQAQVTARSATARAELRVTGMVGVMISCFLVAWSPYAVVSLIIAFGGPKGRKLITPVVSVLPAIFAKSATCYNPLIYVGLNTQFQNAWRKLFGIQRESCDNQTRLTLSASAVGGTTTGGPVLTVSKTIGVSPMCSKLPSPNVAHDQKSTPEARLNETDNLVMSTTATIELVPLTSQEPQDLEGQTQGNNDIHSST